MKVVFDNWNTQTTLWLRHVCYYRIPKHKVNSNHSDNF